MTRNEMNADCRISSFPPAIARYTSRVIQASQIPFLFSMESVRPFPVASSATGLHSHFSHSKITNSISST